MRRIGIALALVVSLAVVFAALVTAPALAGGKVSICHRDQGKPEWKEIEIAESALPAHLAHQWGADIYPVPDGGCPGVPTGVPTDVPTEVPTDEPTSTSTPVPTDAPTDVATPTATSAVVESTATPNEPDHPTDAATAAPTATATPNQLTETPDIVVPCPVPSGVTCRSGNG